ncbi:MAG: hypothetical protein GC168_06085 [Candidatus Hydrogenedens sp.]|nr:hypothetical protein [Candidatus Hydrogenedens sp.]
MKRVVNFLASYGLACVLLFFLLLLTFFGTIEQVDSGLYEVQRKYFESVFVIHEFNDWFHLPLPGVYLLMVLLFINMSLGAIVRAPKSWTRPGMLIAHGGILLLLVSGFVTYEFSTSGHMTLYEGESDDHFQSYYDWNIKIVSLDTDPPMTYTIPGEEFVHMGPSDTRTFFAEKLPFTLLLEGYMPNCAPQQTPPIMAMGVDGVILQPMEMQKDAERNLAGVIATVMERPADASGAAASAHGAASTMQGGDAHVGLLWGMAAAPWIVTVQGQRYAIDLRHDRFPVPFRITLNKFIHQKHPRTGMASNFESRVTMTEGNASRDVEIKMNEPLRHKGFTFFQASFVEDPTNPRAPIASVFSVVKNPADQWPKYACYIIGIGLTIHFLQRLAIYLRAQKKRQSHEKA